jgi:magnesium transporter
MRISSPLKARRLLPLKNKIVGAPPGSLEYTGVQQQSPVTVHLLQYNSEEMREGQETDRLPVAADDVAGVTWFDVRGLHNIDLIEQIGNTFSIRSLILEDILDVQQRPKFEEYEDSFSIIVRAFRFHPQSNELETEQVALFVRDNICISFQEDGDDLFLPVRERLLKKSGRIRQRDAAYLAYALADTIVDGYFSALDTLESRLDRLEAQILRSPERRTKSRIHDLRLSTLTLRKAVSPLREAANRFAQSDHPLITEDMHPFLRDLHDHTIQVMDMVETYRDILNGLYDLYVSEISFKMNSIMQVLTVISTIFIPLSFLVGVYGMNFDVMPELHYPYGYFVLWGVIVLIVIGQLWYFRHRQWL